MPTLFYALFVTEILHNRYIPNQEVFDSNVASWDQTTARGTGGICYCQTYDLTNLHLEKMSKVQCFVSGAPNGHYDCAWTWGNHLDRSGPYDITPGSSWVGNMIKRPSHVTVYVRFLSDSGNWSYYVTSYRLIIYAEGWVEE